MSSSALAGLLAVLLIMASAFSVSHTLHQCLHSDGAANSHFCLVCSLAKGQVNAAVVVSLSVMLIVCCLWSFRLADTPRFQGFDYRISLSRAPPPP